MSDFTTTTDPPEQDRATTAKPRGHAPKIQLAHMALKSEGRLPRKLRPVERNRLVLNWLDAHGYGDHLPSRQAIDRYFQTSDT